MIVLVAFSLSALYIYYILGITPFYCISPIRSACAYSWKFAKFPAGDFLKHVRFMAYALLFVQKHTCTHVLLYVNAKFISWKVTYVRFEMHAWYFKHMRQLLLAGWYRQSCILYITVQGQWPCIPLYWYKIVHNFVINVNCWVMLSCSSTIGLSGLALFCVFIPSQQCTLLTISIHHNLEQLFCYAGQSYMAIYH